MSPGAALVALVALLAGCGGTSWNAARSAGSPAATVTTRPATAATLAAERTYVDALVASAGAQPGSTGVAPGEIRCIASAIVHGFGVAAFTAHGITPAVLRKPDSNLDALADPTDAQTAAMGAALQHCGIGTALGKGLAHGLQVVDPGAIACFARGFDTNPALRRFVVIDALGRKVDLGAAHDVVGLMAACIDLPTLVLRAANFQVDAATRACLVNALQGSSAQLKDYFALRVSGSDPTTEQQDYEAIMVGVNHCRPGAHTGFTVPSG